MAQPADDAAVAAEAARAEGLAIQAKIDAAPAQRDEARAPMQSGQREYPARFPAQHLRKHAAESELTLAPMFEAPGYKGSGKLDGMVALVTGGSTGIGRAIVTLYAREGADIAIVYLTGDDDAGRTKAIVEAEGRRCILLQGDIADTAFCEAAVAATVAQLGGLDVLVNNAAFQQHVPDILALSDAQMERTVRTNLYGTLRMTRAAVPHLRPRGSIIMTGSVTGLRGSPELIDYSMTKGGIHALTKALAMHLVPRGIRVNAVAPGPVWTALNPADRPAAQVAKFGSDTPMGRAAQPEEIAPLFVFLASPVTGSYVTGEIMAVDGGMA